MVVVEEEEEVVVVVLVRAAAAAVTAMNFARLCLIHGITSSTSVAAVEADVNSAPDPSLIKRVPR